MNEGALPELPGGWEWTNLESCIEILDSQRIPINADEREKRIAGKSTSELYPYYGATGQVGWIDDYLFDEELILLGEDGAPFFEQAKNKAYIIKGKSWVNNHAHVLKAIASVTLNQLISNYLNVFDYHGYVTGTTRAKLNQSPMRKIPFPLPPLPEQRRIVVKIEELFTKLDAGVEALKKTKAQLKRYRQSVLKAACEGKLVPTEAELATAEGRTYEPADVLLARILKERREKAGKGAKFKEPAAPDVSGLPEGWCWARIGAVSEIIMGQSPPGESYNTTGVGVPLINGPVEFGHSPFSKTIEAKFTTAPTKMCKQDDLILCVRGSTTGRMNIAGFDACIGRGVAAIRGFIEQWYLNYYIHFNQQNFLDMGTGSTFPNISSNQIAEYFIPIPPLAEQRRIVAEVERRLSVADEVARTVEQSLAQAGRLRQSILKKAFEGKLVAQDERDEPAGVLLERIRQQKQINEQNNKSKRRKTHG